MFPLNNFFGKKNCINSTKVLGVTKLISIQLSSFTDIKKCDRNIAKINEMF